MDSTRTVPFAPRIPTVFTRKVTVLLSLGSVQLFGEARYHSIRTDGGDVHVVPLTVGFIF